MSKITIDKDKLYSFLGLNDVKEELQFLIGCGCADLMHGPLSHTEPEEKFQYKGFTSACKRIKELLADVPCEIYYDNDCGEFLNSLPEGELDEDDKWQEPFLEEIYTIEPLRELCGELKGYL